MSKLITLLMLYTMRLQKYNIRLLAEPKLIIFTGADLIVRKARPFMARQTRAGAMITHGHDGHNARGLHDQSACAR
jgi:hypothetical protein